jgi:A/G-specific adenine glycosylase
MPLGSLCRVSESKTSPAEISGLVLAWYDHNARDLPWRIAPAADKAGKRPDPYTVWLSEIMLQQTTVKAVEPYFQAFTTRWPKLFDLAAAADEEVMAAWAGLGYYARARNLLKCARVITRDFGGAFPKDRAAMQRLPGIGPYTSAAIAAIAFGQPETVVDGNIERIMARLFAVENPLPKAKPRLAGFASGLTPKDRPGDYAQGLMDIGSTICTPRDPTCGICPLSHSCKARKLGCAGELPRREVRPPKPVRRGIVYVAVRADGALLLERRPDTGLLGGMLGWPGGDWGATARPDPPIEADWQSLPDEVRHTFTHFHLRLEIRVALGVPDTEPRTGRFVPVAEFDPSTLPTVMRKIYDLVSQSCLNV